VEDASAAARKALRGRFSVVVKRRFTQEPSKGGGVKVARTLEEAELAREKHSGMTLGRTRPARTAKRCAGC